MNASAIFDAVLVERRAPDDPRIAVLSWWGKRFAELGFTPSYGPGDHGNLSCRTATGVLITARETAKATLQPEHFVEVLGSDEGQSIPCVRCRGLRLPSTDTWMHLRLYRRRPDIQAILHGHDPATLAKAEALRLPVTTVSAAAPSLALIENVCALADHTDYLLLQEHGFLALGRSIDEAGDLVRMLCAKARSLAS